MIIEMDVWPTSSDYLQIRKKKEKNKGSLDTGVACLGSLTWGRNKQLF